MEPAPEEWSYLDRSGREFGPFPTAKLRAWFAQDYFPIGKKLLVRARGWARHVPVHELFPDGEPFEGPPRLPPPAPVDAPPAPAPAPAPGPPPGPTPIYGPPPPGYGLPPPAYGYGAYGLGYGPPAYGYPPAPGYGAYGAPVYGAPYGYGYAPPPPALAYGRSPSRSRSPGGRRGRPGRRRSEEGPGARFRPHHSSQVPRRTDLSAKFTAGGGPATTAMLRNIPNKYTQEQLLEEINGKGFSGTYDFFYLPIDVKNEANVGYAFINFLEPRDFERFCHEFSNYRFQHSGSTKITAVSSAVVQGLRQNVENLMRKRVAQGRHGPVLLRDGRRLNLEEMADALQLN